MKQDAVVLYVLVTIFGCCCCRQATAFVTSSQLAAQSVVAAQQPQQQQQQQQLNSMTAGYPAAATAAGRLGLPTYMPTGSVSFQPHDMENSNERSVYNPGDELLRALNAELAASGTDLGTLPQEPDYADTVFNELEVANKYDILRKLEDDLREEQDIVSKSAILMQFLEDPSMNTLPVVYVEEAPLEEPDNILYPAGSGMEKRTRYYRRYPWKRHNRNRSSNYEPELRYACTPSKEDVFKLLVGLHENRKGNLHKTVQFCNRKRPAKAIFTNIRFLG